MMMTIEGDRSNRNFAPHEYHRFIIYFFFIDRWRLFEGCGAMVVRRLLDGLVMVILTRYSLSIGGREWISRGKDTTPRTFRKGVVAKKKVPSAQTTPPFPTYVRREGGSRPCEGDLGDRRKGGEQTTRGKRENKGGKWIWS